ncbi:MAG: hypothetical protein U9O56_05440 [Campylobacterota bacterium]|nr:hypothetical protein [Campylobacterota bacterium]
MLRKVVVYPFVFVSSVVASDYEFSFDELEEIETKSYEYSSYIKTEHKHQILNKTFQETYLGEFYLNYKYFQDKYTFYGDFLANYENIDKSEDSNYNLNQAYINYKYNDNHQLNIGKKTPKWGKGYFVNPIAFIDKRKDPNNPEASRQGYTLLNYKYNKVYKGDIKNSSIDIIYLRTTKELNDELYDENSNILALKSYILYKDIDIDLVYVYSDEVQNSYGVDFSTNIETNFEIHGEYGANDDHYHSYLFGLKYLTSSELTILSEYYYQNKQQTKKTPFYDNRYFINNFTKKEPCEILYFNIYYKNILNIDDNSHQNNLGFVYSKIKNLEIDLSYGDYIGNSSSEYGQKLVDKFTYLKLKYSF